MDVHIRTAYLQSLGYNASDLYLNSSGSLCTPQITPEYVKFHIPYGDCGTVRQVRTLVVITFEATMHSDSFRAILYICTQKLHHVHW